MKISRGLPKLSFKAGSVFKNNREKPKYVKFGSLSKSQILGSLKTIQFENKLEPLFS